MKCIVKNNNELSREDISKYYNLFSDNMMEYTKKPDSHVSLNDEYKEKWINETLTENNLKFLSFYDDDDAIAGYVVAIEKEKNFIRDFQIVDRFQHDGRTFRFMVEKVVETFDNGKPFYGFIWSTNLKSKIVFTKIGCRINDNKAFEISADDLKKWLDKIN